ncbi:Na(+)/citrate cotransporter-like [Haemaphysalis longicornis]
MLSKQNPLLFLVPVVKALSFVGILPLAHYPCALLYENFGISVPGMMKTGVPFKCTLLLLELLTLSTLGLPFFGLDKMPAWARAAAANLSAHDETKRS